MYGCDVRIRSDGSDDAYRHMSLAEQSNYKIVESRGTNVAVNALHIYLAKYERNSGLLRLSANRFANPLWATFGACWAIVIVVWFTQSDVVDVGFVDDDNVSRIELVTGVISTTRKLLKRDVIAVRMSKRFSVATSWPQRRLDLAFEGYIFENHKKSLN